MTDHRKYLPKIAAFGSDGSCYGFAMGKHRISQDIEELAELSAFLEGRGIKSYLELGAGAFGLGCYFAKTFGLERAACVTLPDHPAYRYLAECLREMNDGGTDAVGGVCRTDSELALGMAKGGGPWDLLFIDASWGVDRDGYKTDLNAYLPYVSPGGVIAFHDTMEFDLANRIAGWCKDLPVSFGGCSRRRLGTDWYVKEPA